MREQDHDRLSDHEYDGIREYDNPLPGWWVAIFWVTIVITPLYVLHYHFGRGESVIAQYDREMVEHYELQAKQALAAGSVSEETLAGLQRDTSMMSVAQQVFAGKCAVCHGSAGEGKIGPNLTDDYWLHGGGLTDIYTTVSNGVPEKGMVSWRAQLQPAELLAVSAYVGTLRGTNPPNAKPPQGTKPGDATTQASL